MLFYIPYGTDAPVYCRPVVTMAMIVINVLVFTVLTQEQIAPYMLVRGEGLHPLQWITSNFLHAGLFHLAFNMLFLWTFGPVIEGRVGSLKMLAIYLGIGILQCAAEQLLFLGSEPSRSLGSSPVVLGLAAMSLIWSPESKVHAYRLVLFFFRISMKDTETEIMLIFAFFTVVDALASIVLFGNFMTPLIHFIGAVIGFGLAIVMLRNELVDCESADIFSVYSGAKDRAEIEARKPTSQRIKEEQQKRENLLSEEIELALEHGTPLPAFIIARQKEREFIEWRLPQDLHFTMIQQLLGGKHEMEAVVSMRQYLERHQDQASFVKMMLAQALLAQNKPNSTSKVLNSMLEDEPDSAQKPAIHKLLRRAETMHRKNLNEGIYEGIE